MNQQDQLAIDSFVQTIQTDYAHEVEKVALFGSKARGDDHADSDIDLLVLLRRDDFQLWQAISTLGANVSLHHDVLISVRAISPERWNKLVTRRYPFYESIQADWITLYPTKSEIQG